MSGPSTPAQLRADGAGCPADPGAQPGPVELTVVLVAYRPGAMMREFLDSVRQASARSHPALVIDNYDGVDAVDRCDPELAAAFSGCPDVTLRGADGNLGFGRAANEAIAEVQTDWVLLANPDLTLRPGSLDALLAARSRWPQAAAFGPAILTPDGALYPSARALPSLGRGIGHALFGWWWPANPWTQSYRAERGDPVEGTAGWLSGSCLLLRVDAFREVGGFDPRYFMYFEDLDLCERLGRAGWQSVYVPDAVVVHEGGGSTRLRRAEMVTEHHRSAYLYLSRRYAGLRWLPVRLVLRAGLATRNRLSRSVGRIGEGAQPVRSADALHQD